MLQVYPYKRPTASELLNMPELKNNLGETCAKLSADNKNHDLLGTIRMPRNLRDLKNRLPKSQYNKIQRTKSLSALSRNRNDDNQSRVGSSLLRYSGSQSRNSSSNRQEPPRSNIIIKKKALEPLYQLPKPRRFVSIDYSDRRSALRQAGDNSLSRKDQKIVHHINFSHKKSEKPYLEEEKVSRQVPYKYQVGASPRGKPPLNALNPNVPNPRIVNHHKKSPGFAINNGINPSHNRFGLPPASNRKEHNFMVVNASPKHKIFSSKKNNSNASHDYIQRHRYY